MTSYQTRSGQYRRLRRGKAEEVEEDKKKEMGRGEEDPVKGKERNVSTFHTTTVVVRTPPIRGKQSVRAVPAAEHVVGHARTYPPCDLGRETQGIGERGPRTTSISHGRHDTRPSSSHHDAILDGRRRNQKLGEAMVMPRRAEEEGAGKGFWGGGRIKREEKRVWSIAFVDAWVSFETHLGSLC
ncbi:hypothetical protein BHM03_00017721 [Ensete ventricosum]|nr:hypothetical protein BHM03_00017721 [Ensete ventricosum]